MLTLTVNAYVQVATGRPELAGLRRVVEKIANVGGIATAKQVVVRGTATFADVGEYTLVSHWALILGKGVTDFHSWKRI
jgi:hypothetical protein